MLKKFINRVNSLIILISFFCSLKAPSNPTLTYGNLFHDGIAYFTETLQTPTDNNVFRSTILVEIPGIRINYVPVNANMSRGFIRNIFKTNYSLRAGASYRDMLVATLVLEILEDQSWRVLIWTNYGLGQVGTFMTSSGPAFDIGNEPIDRAMLSHIDIVNAIKNTSISLQEIQYHRLYFNINNRNAMENKTPTMVADDAYNIFSSLSVEQRLDLNLYTRLHPFPFNAISDMFLYGITVEECNACLEDFRHAPIESQVIDDVIYTAENLINMFKNLWAAQLPDTSYKANSRNINCTTYGTEVIINCRAGTSGDTDIILKVNLGPITKESLIAIDLVKTQFETYANAPGSPLNGTGITYRIEWVPYSGCCLALIRLNADAPTILDNNINQLGMLKIAFDQFRINLTEQEIRNNLISNWSNSLGINQSIREFSNWNIGSTSLANIRSWWVEVFGGGEAAFTELDTLRASINAGQIPATLYADIREIIEETFTASNSRFTYWVFTKP
ncbi:hypothetical protein [Candidatus Similichlamydia epinepheli]|uniref:hypothetical protein n=1 Tax=Candidatus Similichlamydia epinepheli TaxID=1903953 RepID=UPI00195D5175|nr:hypothetical protein [Candidatus Similichlamydia epinepheli]